MPNTPSHDITPTADLFEKYRAGCTISKDRLIAMNMGLVHSVARRYQYAGDELDDIVQEGALGMIRAVEKFNPDLGFKFSTYAVPWIRARIEAYLSNYSLNAKVPEKTAGLARRVSATADRLESQGMDKEKIVGYIANELQKKESAIIKLLSIRLMNTDLNAKIKSDDEGSIELIDMIPGKGSLHLDAERESTRKWLSQLMKRIPEKQAEAISYFYGIGNIECKSFAEAAREMGVTREYVRVLCKKGIKSIKSEFFAANDSVTISDWIS